MPTEQAHPGHAVELVEHVRMAVVHANLYEREQSEWAMFVIHRLRMNGQKLHPPGIN